MAKMRIGKLASKAKGLVIGFLNNPNTYLIVGTWIYLSWLFHDLFEHPRTGFEDFRFGYLLMPGKWVFAAQLSKEALVLFGGMFAVCRIAKAIEAGKASAGTSSHSSEKPE
jgi:hypothetical protein